MKPNQKDELEKKTDNEFVRKFAEEKYKYGFTTEVHTDIIERGLNEDVIRLISSKKDEPEWLLEFRLKAYRHWLTLEMPTWAHLRIPEIDYQAISYYADPTKKKEGPKSMEEVDPELIKTFINWYPWRNRWLLAECGGCRYGLRFRKDYLQGNADGERNYL